MAYKKCSACNKWYDSSLGGCTNAGCTGRDQARVARIVTTPTHPATKQPIVNQTKLKPVAKGTTAVAATPTATASPKVADAVTVPKLNPVQLPVALSAEQDSEMATLEMQQAEAGHHLIYRGDSRTPAQLKGYGGFTAWVPLNTEQARNVIKRSNGQNFTISLPPKTKRLEGYFNEQKNINMITLGRQIKLEKAGDTFHISTDPTEACGGFASAYVYGMRFKTLYVIDKQGNAASRALTSVKGINSLLVLDTAAMEHANVIAVAIPGQAGVEVGFLTTIPIANIYKYRKPSGTVWYKMPS